MITAEELQKVLVAAGVPQGLIIIMDEDYVMTTPDWITGKLGKALNKFFFDTGIKAQYSQYDCNKYAKTASTIADWCWATTRDEAAALAFGMFAYIGDLGPHMLNIAIHRHEDENLHVAFYEPQPGIEEGTIAFAPICLLPKILDAQSVRSCLSCLFL